MKQGRCKLCYFDKRAEQRPRPAGAEIQTSFSQGDEIIALRITCDCWTLRHIWQASSRGTDASGGRITFCPTGNDGSRDNAVMECLAGPREAWLRVATAASRRLKPAIADDLW